MKPVLLFVVTEDWYFLSHRLPMARAAQAAGYDVAVAARESGCRNAIEAAGIRLIALDWDRRTLAPLAALRAILELRAVYRRERPAIVHHIAMKPVLFGAIAAWLARVPVVVNAFAGLGFAFVSRSALARLVRLVLLPLFWVLLRRRTSLLLLQNDDDRAMLLGLSLVRREQIAVIRGSGVDMNAARVENLPAPEPYLCVFAGRMIDIKGLADLRAAFAILARTRPDITLWLCGEPDPGNPRSWTRERLEGWGGNVSYRSRQDMRAVWPMAHLAVQPSLGGEGVPKSLLEAAACGRAIVATDVPGCRDAVEDGVTGCLVPPGNPVALADAIDRLCRDPDRLAGMGRAGRERLESMGLTAAAVERQTARFYRDCPVWIRQCRRPTSD